ncbi:TadE family type IV pilus minor pilin [Streptomyces sp. NA04227]|uniref:TadE family type IV pilus minor pilin n=1 Tax=Streptomyces sp. NA04227 TaxID=2742136 RepID=UPI0034CECDA6
MALPVLAVFAMGLMWALLTAAAQIQCVDAARVGARAAARQEPPDAVVAAVKKAAPGGARVEVRREGGLVKVRVVADSPGPGPLSVGLEHEAAALAEETVGREPAGGAEEGAEDRTADGTEDGTEGRAKEAEGDGTGSEGSSVDSSKGSRGSGGSTGSGGSSGSSHPNSRGGAA